MVQVINPGRMSAAARTSFAGTTLHVPSCRSALRCRPCRPVSLFNFFKKKAPLAPPVRETVIPEPSYNIPVVLGALSIGTAVQGSTVPASVLGLLAAFLAFQATNVRFRFEDQALSVVFGASQQEVQNVIVGGENRWEYGLFTNWELWWPGFPILVYFKETQTKPEGQIHFFPVIFDGKKTYDVMVERCGPSQNSLPKPAAAAGEIEEEIES